VSQEVLRSRWSSFGWSERSWSVVLRRVRVGVFVVVGCGIVKAISLGVNQPTYQ
jgi:hypothetical protein